MKDQNFNLRKAKVIDINDPDKKGKIQVRVIPELVDVERSLLPWVRPFLNSGMTKNQQSLHLPEKDSMVWVFFLNEDMFYNGYYVTGQFIDGFFDFDNIADRIEKAEGSEEPEYPNIDFTLSRGGKLMYENVVTGEWGVLQKNGLTVVCNSFGGLIVDNGMGNITMADNGEVTINNNFTVKV